LARNSLNGRQVCLPPFRIHSNQGVAICGFGQALTSQTDQKCCQMRPGACH
jgi:hypothetical protein